MQIYIFRFIAPIGRSMTEYSAEELRKAADIVATQVGDSYVTEDLRATADKLEFNSKFDSEFIGKFQEAFPAWTNVALMTRVFEFFDQHQNYPHASGDFTALGPECVLTPDKDIIMYQGKMFRLDTTKEVVETANSYVILNAK